MERMCAKLLQWCPTLCDPMDCSLPGSSVHGILQARILEWVAMLSSRASSQPRDRTCIAGGFFITSATWEACPPNGTAKTPAPHMVSKAPVSSPGPPCLVWALTIPILSLPHSRLRPCCSLSPAHPSHCASPLTISCPSPWSPRPDRCASLSPPPTWYRPPCQVKPPHPVRPPV